MLKPLLVRDIVQAVRSRVSIPVTVKCRTGVDGTSFSLSLSLSPSPYSKIEIAMRSLSILFRLWLEFQTLFKQKPVNSLPPLLPSLINKYSTS